ncbi:MAG: hypothetical protein IPL61_21585 [Myxococcales bacterium]|nr:hypothetical protein [Myxococcales bacterium]
MTTTTNRYDEIIGRNRATRVRDFGFALLLAAVTAFALGSIGTAGSTAHAATPTAGAAHACAVTVTTC